MLEVLFKTVQPLSYMASFKHVLIPIISLLSESQQEFNLTPYQLGMTMSQYLTNLKNHGYHKGAQNNNS